MSGESLPSGEASADAAKAANPRKSNRRSSGGGQSGLKAGAKTGSTKAAPDPNSLAAAVAQLIALRGWARDRDQLELDELWSRVVEPEFLPWTRPQRIVKGVLQVAVKSAAMLSQLNNFHRPQLIARLQQQSPQSKIREIRFRLEP